MTNNTNNEMTFDPTAVDGIDQNSVENTGVTYPSIQWHYGDIKLKKAGGMDYQGGWFLKSDVLDENVLTAAGWQKTSWTHDSGTEDEGFYRREIAVSVIAMRKRWEVAANGLRQTFSWNNYEVAKSVGRPSSRTHALVLIKGLESVGPVVLTLKGSASMAFEGTRTASGALAQFTATVLTAANRASEAAAKKAGNSNAKRWPYRAFWMPVGAARSANGDPIFTEVGRDKDVTKIVLPVALGLPAKPDGVNLGAFYVGNELLAVVNDLWTVAEATWTHAWDTIASGSEINGVAAETEAVATAEAEVNVLETLGL